jgi:DNA-binding CsgD family transcriptional regulator
LSRSPSLSVKHAPRSLGAALEAVLGAQGQAEKLKSILERTAVPMTLFDGERRYLDLNRPARLMARSNLEKMRRSRIDDFTPPEELPILRGIWDRMLDTGFVAGPRVVPGRGNGDWLEIVYWGLANALPGQHLFAFAPGDWTEDELGPLENAAPEEPASPLTPRELEILQLSAEGFSGSSIAGRLVLSPATVKTHFGHIYTKLDVSGRVAAVARGMRMGLID